MKFGKEFQLKKEQMLAEYKHLGVLNDTDFINYKQLKKLIKVVSSQDEAEKEKRTGSLRYFYENEIRKYLEKLYSLQNEITRPEDKVTLIALFRRLNETANYKICKKFNKNFGLTWDHETMLDDIREEVSARWVRVYKTTSDNEMRIERTSTMIQSNITLLQDAQGQLDLSFMSERQLFFVSMLVCLFYIFWKSSEILSWEWYNRNVGTGDTYPFSIEVVVFARAMILFTSLSAICKGFEAMFRTPKPVLFKIFTARALYVVGDVLVPTAIAMLSAGVYSVFQTLSIPIIVVIRYFLMKEGQSKTHIIFISILLLGLVGFKGTALADPSSTFLQGMCLVMSQVSLHSMSKVLIEKYAKQDLEILQFSKSKKFQILYSCDMVVSFVICIVVRFNLMTSNMFEGWTWHTVVILGVSIFSNFANNLCLIVTTALINVLSKTVAITAVFFAGIGIFRERVGLQSVLFAIVVFVAAISYQLETQQKMKRTFKHQGQVLEHQKRAMVELLEKIDISDRSDSDVDNSSTDDSEEKPNSPESSNEEHQLSVQSVV